MFFVYVLLSLKNAKRYIGYTSKNVFVRLKEHNRHCNRWTKQNSPFILLYSEAFESKTDAIKREHFLKSGQGRKLLDNILKR